MGKAAEMSNDPLADARDLVTVRYPHARWALLSGSVTTVHRTPGSDLDIVVLLPDGDPEAPHRDSLRFRQWPVELFVHDEQTLAHYLAKDLHSRRPVLHRMVAAGIPLVGDPSSWQASCAAVLNGGPSPLTAAERRAARYALTDVLDDLKHSADVGERAVIAVTVWVAAAHLALGSAGHWSGNGKWLLRELRDLDADLADRWIAAHGDEAATASFARDVLDAAGGPLFAGYRVIGERP
jgi:hypothetical protein